MPQVIWVYNILSHDFLDLFSVSLEPSLSAIEIGVSGPCLLRIEDGAIVLYSECGRNRLYHWASDNIKNLTTTGEQLHLEVYKSVLFAHSISANTSCFTIP